MLRFLQILVFVVLVSTAQGRAAKTGQVKIAEKANRNVCPEGAKVCVLSDNALCFGHGLCCFKGNENTKFCVCDSPWKGVSCQELEFYESLECPLGFTYVHSIGKCYKVIWEALDWYSAAKKCDEAGPGSYLAAITSAEENREVKTFLTTEISRNLGNTACLLNGNTDVPMYWTSGQQLVKGNCKSPFVWKQSSDKLTAFDYTSWNVGEPNCGSKEELCMGIDEYNDFRWDDIFCRSKICPLCEYTL